MNNYHCECVRNYTKYGIAHLDLDTLAWMNTTPPKRKSIEESGISIKTFLDENNKWVIEGCYSYLLSIVIKHTNKLIFLNPGV